LSVADGEGRNTTTPSEAGSTTQPSVTSPRPIPTGDNAMRIVLDRRFLGVIAG
jgi:hypothetical protein